LLEGIVTDPEQRIGELPLLTETEKHQLLVEWNDTEIDYPNDKCIHELFEAQVDKTPDAVALIFEDQQITYRVLNNRANQLAHYLQKFGVGPEVLVGICLDRSIEMIVGLLAILKAGGAYVPLDPTYPNERLEFMVKDAQVQVLITQENLLPIIQYPNTVCLDLDRPQIDKEPDHNPINQTTAENLAYLIYTSGSTGQPKGVQGLHRGMINRFVWMWETFPFEPGEICCQKTSVSFVDSIWEMFGPLLKGVPIVIVPEPDAQNPKLLIETLAQSNVTRLILVPSLLRAILDSHVTLSEKLHSLKICISSGEALAIELVKLFASKLPNARLINLYGSSEVSADVSFWESDHIGEILDRVPIGRPISNTNLYVLDGHRRVVPVGIWGELYVGGVSLARGYLNRDTLTSERFIPDFITGTPGAMLFKTGDLVRYRPDGNLEYLQRIDHLVKIRGYRIELGEIGSALNSHPGIKAAHLVARPDPSGEIRLIAYYVRAEVSNSVTAATLREYLATRLPKFMIPGLFVEISALPRTVNGKIDPKALPDPTREQVLRENTYVAPRDEIEFTIHRLWSDVLGVERIGIDDDFFLLGGHSLLAAKLFIKLDEAFGHALPLSVLFVAPTIRTLAERYRIPVKHKLRALVELRAGGAETPIFAIPGLYGNVLGFADLARELGEDHPFYGLQSLGLDGRDTPLDSINEMATVYLDEIRSVQKHGPYALIGACFGASVAYDIARQLLSEGEEVAFLGLLDPARIEPIPGSKMKISSIRSLQRPVTLGLIAFGRLQLYLKELKQLNAKDRLKFVTQKLRNIRNLAKGDQRSYGLKREIFQLEVYRANLRALTHYKKPALTGRLRTLEIIETKIRYKRTSTEISKWSDLWQGSISLHAVPGKDSGDMLRRENARALAMLLKRRLRAAFCE
jgi:amino acid adenylation domain-containing protein